MELGRLLRLLEERLVQHDDNRREVQNELHEACTKGVEEADSLEETIINKAREAFDETEERILGLIVKLNEGDNLDTFIGQAQNELSTKQRYKIGRTKGAKSFIDLYKLEIASVQIEGKKRPDELSQAECIANKLQKHLDKTHESMVVAQSKIAEICSKRRDEVEENEKRVNAQLESLFIKEDARLQEVVGMIRRRIDNGNTEETNEAIIKAKSTLLTKQRYVLKKTSKGHSFDRHRLVAKKEVSLECFEFRERKPTNFTAFLANNGKVFFSFSFFDEHEEVISKSLGLSFEVVLRVWRKSHSESTTKTFTNAYPFEDTSHVLIDDTFLSGTTYSLKMKVKHHKTSSKWSEKTKFTTPKFKVWSVWKECPDCVYSLMRYTVDPKTSRIATKISTGTHCTIVGNTPLPLRRVTSWSIKVISSHWNDGSDILVGVAPFDIDQRGQDNYNCGWYFSCYRSLLCSGPPHNYNGKEYGPVIGGGKYVKTGSSVGVVVDTRNGEVSFVLGRVNLGAAYEAVPLDKPLIPCVLLKYGGDSVEFDPALHESYRLDQRIYESPDQEIENNSREYCLIS